MYVIMKLFRNMQKNWSRKRKW